MPTTKEAIERFKWLENQHVAVAIWREDDVLELAMEEGIRCSRKRAREIIDEIDHKQDAMMGISWGTIRVYLKEYGWGARNKDDEVNYHTDQSLNKLRKFHSLLNGELPM